MPGKKRKALRKTRPVAPRRRKSGPPIGDGKICYIELPSSDPERSSQFYANAFGWPIRRRRDGHLAFDDTAGQVSGSWVRGRQPASEPGILFYIMADDIQDAINAVTSNGGTLVQPVGAHAPEITARFRDPDGNIIGLYQLPAHM